MEPTGEVDEGEIAARVVKVASWQDDKTGLMQHEPELTGVIVALHTDEFNTKH